MTAENGMQRIEEIKHENRKQKTKKKSETIYVSFSQLKSEFDKQFSRHKRLIK